MLYSYVYMYIGAEGFGSPDAAKPPSFTTPSRSQLHPAVKSGGSRSRSLGRVFKMLSKARRKSKSPKEFKGEHS